MREMLTFRPDHQTDICSKGNYTQRIFSFVFLSICILFILGNNLNYK